MFVTRCKMIVGIKFFFNFDLSNTKYARNFEYHIVVTYNILMSSKNSRKII